MEEKNISAQLEDDELLIEEDLEEEEELLDEEDDPEEVEEEYDFNDEDDFDDDDEAPEDGESSEEGTDDAEVPADEKMTPETEPEAGSEEKPDDEAPSDAVKAKMVKLLDRLGYRGTYEEAMAAYEADEAKKAEEKPSEEAPAEAETVDYVTMASNSLRDINAAFGTEYVDFSQFDDLSRFAQLMMGGATAIEAYRATQKQFVSAPSPDTKEDTEPASKPSKDHLTALPKAGAGETGMSHADRQALASLRELYPERSVKDLKKTLDRVKRARA